jgi:hypothetical protein
MVNARVALGTACIGAVFVLLPPLVNLRAEVAPGSTAKLVLDWQAPPHCPDREALLSDVESLLAHSRREGGGERIYAQGRVVPSRGGYRMRLEVEGAHRELDGPSCENLARAAALLIALVLNPQLQPASDPLRRAAPSISASASVSAAPDPSTSVSATPSPAISATRTSSAPANQVWLYLGPVLDAGTLPATAMFGAVGAAWGRSSWRLSARLSWAAPSHWDVGANGRVTFQAFGIGSRACIGTTSGWLRGGLCAGLEGLRIDAEGSGLADPTSAGAWTFAVGGDVDLRVRLWDTWFLAAEASLLGPLVGLNVLVDGGPSYRSGAALRLGAFVTKAFQVF